MPSERGEERKHSPLPLTFPPNPPLPRRTTVDWFSKIFFPVALSTVSMMTVTEAAFPCKPKKSPKTNEERSVFGFGASNEKSR